MNTIVIFIQKEVPENKILTFLKDSLDVEIESDNVENHKAIAYLQYISYQNEFATMISLSCPDVAFDEKAIAESIAQTFETQTLIELTTPVDGFDYLLISSNKEEKLVKIFESESGIKIC